MPKIDGEFLDDLASRFIINVPIEERSNLIRMCFQVELAHWFYLDFFCATEGNLVPFGIKQFAVHIFKHVPFLRPHVPNLEQIMEDWKKYKLSVPTYGAILVSADLKHVLLVQSFWAKSSWGFPKGKVNENENPLHCAIREVYEETGFDASHLISPNDFFESIFNYQFTRLYVVAGVPMTTEFVPRTRNEIKSCEWFPIDLLPNHKTDTDCKATLGMNANSFFMVMPFIKKLKKWVAIRREQRKHQNNKLPKSESKAANNNKRQRHKSMGDIENLWQGNGNNPHNATGGGGGNGQSHGVTHTPGDNHVFYQQHSNAVASGSKTVPKCGETPLNRQHGTPVEGSGKGRSRDKGAKPNIKRQLFVDSNPSVAVAVNPGNTPTSPSPFSFAFTNFPVDPLNVPPVGGVKVKATGVQSGSGDVGGQDSRVPLKKMECVRFREWDSFTFDINRISKELSGFLVRQ